MIRRSGYKIYTKVTQYFTDDNSTVGYSHTLTQPTESFCGTDFNYEHVYNSSLSNGKWRDCLYGPYTFCSGSTSSSACSSGDCSQFYLDTPTIVVDYNGHIGDATSNITLYTGSRLYLSSSLELAPDGYYVSGGLWYKVGNGDCCGWNDGTFMLSGSCEPEPPSSSLYSLGTADRIGATTCDIIGTTPEIFLDSTDYAKYITNGGCFVNGNGTNKVSVVRDAAGSPLTGTFYFVWYGVSCDRTTFKSTFGNITDDERQC